MSESAYWEWVMREGRARSPARESIIIYGCTVRNVNGFGFKAAPSGPIVIEDCIAYSSLDAEEGRR